MANTVTMTLTEYNTLLGASERIEAAERFLNANKYVTADDVASVLGIERKVASDDVYNG